MRADLLARAVLLFHRGGPWTPEDRAAWKELTGSDEATTRTLCDLARQAAEPERYLIWSNEHMAWWAPGRHGYVRRLSEAGRYTRGAALDICANAILGGTADRLGLLPELPVREADAVAMQAAYKKRHPKPEKWE